MGRRWRDASMGAGEACVSSQMCPDRGAGREGRGVRPLGGVDAPTESQSALNRLNK